MLVVDSNDECQICETQSHTPRKEGATVMAGLRRSEERGKA